MATIIERKATKILWDTDGEKIALPTEVVIPSSVVDDEVADFLSDKIGYCHFGYQMTESAWRLDKEGRAHVQMCNEGWSFTICHWGDRLFTNCGVLEDPYHRRSPTEAVDMVWDFFCQD